MVPRVVVHEGPSLRHVRELVAEVPPGQHGGVGSGVPLNPRVGLPVIIRWLQRPSRAVVVRDEHGRRRVHVDCHEDRVDDSVPCNVNVIEGQG